MLHLLPESYIQEVKKEYRMRSFVAACNLLSFCFLIFVLGMIPSLVIVSSAKDELNKQSNALTLRIADSDKALATSFEAAVKQGVATLRHQKTLSLAQVNHVLSLKGKGISLLSVSIIREGEAEQAQVRGVASTRTDLSNFIKEVNAEGQYSVEDVPASTFTKDKDIPFDVILRKNNTAQQ